MTIYTKTGRPARYLLYANGVLQAIFAGEEYTLAACCLLCCRQAGWETVMEDVGCHQ